jgi:hypothetical protein
MKRDEWEDVEVKLNAERSENVIKLLTVIE